MKKKRQSFILPLSTLVVLTLPLSKLMAKDRFYISKKQHLFIHDGIHVRRGDLMVSALDSEASGPGSSPGRGHCVVFLGKTLYSHSASLHPGV